MSRQSRFSAGAYLRLIRPEQWVKNLFVAIPLFFSGHFHDQALVTRVVIATAAFCLLSSAVYVFNDLRDLEDDRAHAKKRMRPLPSGAVSVVGAGLLCLGLLAAALILSIAWALPVSLLVAGALYLLINVSYSLGLKHIPLLELFMVASGFVIRLVAGSFVVGETLSSWIMVCTALVSLMLVVGKRRGDIAQGIDPQTRRKSLLHYTVPYLDQLMTLLASATVVTYLLFCISDYAKTRFGGDVSLTCVFVLFGVFRFLQIVSVGGGGDSPTTMVIKDRQLRYTILLWLALFYLLIRFNAGGQ
ncbi:MAG TPA: decaprenyl-phosphate phosphoribosyltransferase [Rhizomicrobium sp.]|nr:decaprenyl-phosphate phosphoribosyltransferase [Rhizomicrobium sp.]